MNEIFIFEGVVGVLSSPLGFLIPIFKKRNSLFVQNINEFDYIGGFIELEEQPFNLIECDHVNIECRLRDKGIYAFAFSKSDIVLGDYGQVSEVLNCRVDELADRPFVQAEVFKYLGENEKKYLECIDKGAQVMATSNPQIAENWRISEYERVTSDIFVGRVQENEEFFEILGAKKYNTFCIHSNGQGGIGKTQLLIKFQNSCKFKNIIHTQAVIDFYHSNSHSKVDIMRLIAENLNGGNFTEFEKKLSEYSKSDNEKTRRSLILELERAFENNYKAIAESDDQVVLFFDTYEFIQGGDFSMWLEGEFFPKLVDLNPNTFIVISGRFPIKRISAHITELKPFDFKDTESFLQKCFNVSDRDALAEKIGNSETVYKVHKLAQGHPILLALFADWCLYEPNNLSPSKLIAEIEQKTEDNKRSNEIFEKVLISKIPFLREPEDIAVTYMAFAYRRMTPEMLSVISDISLKDSKNILLKTLKPLSFIKYKGENTVLLHDVMRDMVNRHYWEKVDPDEKIRKQIAERLVKYYEKLLENSKLPEMKRSEYRTEKRYYQLFIDNKASFREFIKDFEEKIENYQLYHCDEIIDQTFYEKLTTEQQLEIDVRRIWWRNEAYLINEAKALIFEIDENPAKREILDENKKLKAYFDHETGVVKHWSNEYDEAIECFKDAEKAFRRYKLQYRLLWALNWLGYTYYRSGNFDKAESTLERGVKEFIRFTKISSAKPDNIYVIIANMYSNLNAVLRHRGRFFEAIQCGEIAVGIARKKNNHRELARFLNALGETYKNLNKNYEALKAYDEALEHLRISPDPLLKARISIGKALIAYRQPDYIYVLEFFNRTTRQEALDSFHRMHPERQKTKQASNLLKEAEDILKKNFKENTVEFADLCFYQAEVATLNNDWKKSLNLFKESEKFARYAHNEYRQTDAVAGQLICYYFLRKDDCEFEQEIDDCVSKIKNTKNNYHNLLGKMELFRGNIAYEKFLNTEAPEDLRKAIKRYVTACNHMYTFSRISRKRFYASFQVLTRRLADIPLKMLNEDILESLRDIWVYDEDKKVCQDYSDKFDEIIDFSIQRIKCNNYREECEGNIHKYRKMGSACIESGGENLRFATVYALMALQLTIENSKENNRIADGYIDLARTYAVDDNIFEAHRTSFIALDCLKDADDDIRKAIVYIGLATILYRRGEYAKLLTRNTRQHICENLYTFTKQSQRELNEALGYFNRAQNILETISDKNPNNQKIENLLSHLYSRKAEYLFLTDSNNSDIERLFKLSMDKGEIGGDIWRQMAAIVDLLEYYYFSGQWEHKKRKFEFLVNEFYYLLKKFREAPVLNGRVETTEADLKYDTIKFNKTDSKLIREVFRRYIVASRVSSEYSYKHFFEVIVTILDRISDLPKESVKVLYEEFPMLKQKTPKGDIAEDTYKLIEQALYIHSEVL